MNKTALIGLILLATPALGPAFGQDNLEPWQIKADEILKSNFPDTIAQTLYPAKRSMWVMVKQENLGNPDLIAKTFCDFTSLANKPKTASFVLSIRWQYKTEKVIGQYICD